MTRACKSDPEAAKESHLSNKGPNGFYQHKRGLCSLELRRRCRRCMRDWRRGLGKHPQATLESIQPASVSQQPNEAKEGPHLAVHRKVDRRVDLLDALTPWHASPVSRWKRTRGHKLRREAESLKPLHEAHNKVARLVQREFLAQTLRITQCG